jgi:hypothetical protein
MNIKIPDKNISALKIIVDKLSNKNLHWVLVGSTALAIHGVNVKVNDIDILTNINSADKIAKQLKEYIQEPMHYRENSQFKSYHGMFKINGVQVELLADLECIYNNKWIKKKNLGIVVYKDFSNMIIPVLDLKEEYEAYKRMGKNEKANKILEVLQR